ncbi:MAG: hypothetical protein AB1487_08845 [Thermodesulfobacteriota bacterium]
MGDILSDQDIDRLLKESKPLPADYRAKMPVRPKGDIRNASWIFEVLPEVNFALFFDRAFSIP